MGWHRVSGARCRRGSTDGLRPAIGLFMAVSAFVVLPRRVPVSLRTAPFYGNRFAAWILPYPLVRYAAARLTHPTQT
jgi:hypothetical protein